MPYLKGAFIFHYVGADSNDGVVELDGVDIGGRGFFCRAIVFEHFLGE